MSSNETDELKSKVAKLQAEVDRLKVLCEQGGAGFPPKQSDTDNEAKNGICSGMICKVNHFAIVVSDAEKSKEFYVGVLGAKILNRPNFPAKGYWLWLGNMQLHLIQGTNASVEASHAAGYATGNVNHLSLEVHSGYFDAVETALKANKVKYTKNLVPTQDSHVIHQLFLPDPDGHYVEICDCNLFTEFVFDEEFNDAKANKLASEYLEGADLLGATVAAACAISLVDCMHMHGKDEDEFHDHIGNLHRCFKLISGGKDTIEVTDWHKFLKRMGHQATEEDVRRSLHEADEDGNGGLSFEEFSHMILHRMKPNNSEDEMRKAFEMMDRNHDGTVDKDELLLMLWGMGQRMDETQLADAIAAADKDGNGALDMEEFLTFVKTQTEEEEKKMD